MLSLKLLFFGDYILFYPRLPMKLKGEFYRAAIYATNNGLWTRMLGNQEIISLSLLKREC